MPLWHQLQLLGLRYPLTETLKITMGITTMSASTTNPLAQMLASTITATWSAMTDVVVAVAVIGVDVVGASVDVLSKICHHSRERMHLSRMRMKEQK